MLVIAPAPALAAAVRDAMEPHTIASLNTPTLREEELRLTAAAVDLCMFDVDLTTVEPIRLIERLRHLLPQCPIILYASDSQRSWEEDAYLLGVNHILTKPVRARLLNSLLDRLFQGNGSAQLPEPQPAPLWTRPPQASSPEPERIPARVLESLRNYSSILSHTLHAESMSREFLLRLREIIGVNRAAIFLRQSAGEGEEGTGSGRTQRLVSACAMGLAPGTLEHLEMSLDSGIGGICFTPGACCAAIAWRSSATRKCAGNLTCWAPGSPSQCWTAKRWSAWRCFDGRVTGEPMSNEELSLIFHLLEQFGQASQEYLAARQGFRPARNDVRHPPQYQQRLRRRRARI